MIDVEIEVRGNRVLVAPEHQAEHQNASGVIVVESYAPEVIGRVIAIGSEVRDVKPDDVVLFPPQAGREMEFGGTTFLILDEDEILLVWDEDHTPV